jgi:hypothetical protein
MLNKTNGTTTQKPKAPSARIRKRTCGCAIAAQIFPAILILVWFAREQNAGDWMDCFDSAQFSSHHLTVSVAFSWTTMAMPDPERDDLKSKLAAKAGGQINTDARRVTIPGQKPTLAKRIRVCIAFSNIHMIG